MTSKYLHLKDNDKQNKYYEITTLFDRYPGGRTYLVMQAKGK
jgi:hypothetical protein